MAEGAVTEFARWIDAQPAVLGTGWVHAQDPRKQEEAEFHDRDREGHRDEIGNDTRANRRFYEAATLPDRRLAEWIRARAPGRTFLDFACGHGNQAIQAALAGAALAVGIDISEVSVRNAQETAARRGVADRTRFLQRDCENTGFPDGAFDLALCSGMLHHLDLPKAYPELHRVLAPGGRVYCYEALSYNPAIQWYRNRTPELRTAWEKEHILGMKDVRLAKQWFRVENVRFYNLATPLAVFMPAALRRPAFAALQGVDAVLTRVPLLQLWSWMFTFELVKEPVR